MKHLSLLILGMLCLSALTAQTTGGPDAYGYIWKDSNNPDPDAPVYNWVDITSIGTPVAGLGDDNSVGPINMNFSFHYYWSDYNRVYIGSNGYVGFQPINISSAGAQAFPTMPTNDANNNFIAPLLSDLSLASPNPSIPNPGTVYFWTNSIDSCVITYDQVPFWNNVPAQWGGSNTFQVILSAQDSSITLQYQSQTGSWDAAYNFATNPAVIGIENVTGTVGLTVSNNTLPVANYAVRFYYPAVVGLNVPDLSTEWVQNSTSGGFFSIAGAPTTGQALIKNVGNVDITGNTSVILNVLDNTNSILFTEIESVPALTQGAGQTVAFTQGFTPPGPGHYDYRVGFSNPIDINDTNDTITSEMIVVDTAGTAVEITYYNGSTPSNLNATSWSGGDADEGVGIYYEPPYYPATVSKVSAFVYTTAPLLTTDAFEIRIFADDAPAGQGTLLASVAMPTANLIAGAWNELSLPVPIDILSGGFYVGWYQTGGDIQLAQETQTPLSLRNYEILNNVWSTFRFNESQESLIRVTLSKSCNIPGGISLGADTAICANNAPLVLNAGMSGMTYSWSTGAATQTLSVDTSGMYSVNVVDANGCTAEDSIGVIVYPVPMVDLGMDVEGCQGDSFMLAPNMAFNAYSWSTGDATQSITVTQNNVYSLTVTDINGCLATDDISVTINPPPAVDLGNDQLGCFGNGQSVTVASNITGDYIWSTGDTTFSIVVDQAGTYWLELTDANGCVAADTINLSDDTPTIDLGDDIVGCEGTPVVLDAGAGFVSYIWSNGGNTQTISVSMEGEYRVDILNSSGCAASDTISVSLAPLPDPDFSAQGGWGANWFTWDFTNLSTGATSYFWDFGDGNGTSTDPNPAYSYVFPGDYDVSLIATNDCGSDTITISISLNNTDGLEDELFGSVKVFPSPNDGQFQILFGEQALQASTIKLYNLQGQLVYQEQFTRINPYQEVEVNLAEPVPGIYLLQLSSEGVEIHYKVMIQ
ncbi:MAG: PKD domain-containing protein [Bacteroidota bacterium]